MKEYVFLRVNEKFKNLFSNDNLPSFLELFFRREESVFYKEQFKLFLEKNKQKEILMYMRDKLGVREGLTIENNKLTLNNQYSSEKEILVLNDNYLVLNCNFETSVFTKYLCEYDSDFLMIDINNSKIQRLTLVN